MLKVLFTQNNTLNIKQSNTPSGKAITTIKPSCSSRQTADKEEVSGLKYPLEEGYSLFIGND